MVLPLNLSWKMVKQTLASIVLKTFSLERTAQEAVKTHDLVNHPTMVALKEGKRTELPDLITMGEEEFKQTLTSIVCTMYQVKLHGSESTRK